MRAKLILPFLILYLFCHLLSVQGHEVDTVNPGSDKHVVSSQVYEVTSEGAWCWFADPRALHYENEKGTINKTYIGYIDIHGNIKAMQYDFKNRRHLHNRIHQLISQLLYFLGHLIDIVNPQHEMHGTDIVVV